MLACALVSACEWNTDPGDCTTEARYGLEIVVRDSISGAIIAAGTTVMIVSGTYQEQQSYPDNVSSDVVFPLAEERPGLYQITVRRAGYIDWKGSALVRSGRCHVETVHLTVRLQRA